MKPKYQTKWDLSLIYKSATDPQIKKDLQKVERAFANFAKKYTADKGHLTSPLKLKQSLKDYEALENLPTSNAYLYFNYQQDLNSRDKKLEAKLNQLEARLQKVSKLILFFPIELSKIEESKQREFLADPNLATYKYFLERLFKEGKHTLTTAEEKIMNLMSLPAKSMWIRGNENLVTESTIKWQGRELPIPSAIGKIPSLPLKERRALHLAVVTKLKEISQTSENELNAIVTHKKIADELRGFTKPYEATALGYQTDMETVENLVKTVSKHFSIAKRFYKVKAKMHKLKVMTYPDRAAEVGKLKKEINFDKAVEITKSAFQKVDPVYRELLEDFLTKGEIDVYPKLGKRGGAYCSSQYGLPTYILLNHQNNFDSVMTLAHELGHAFHSHFSFKHQPAVYRDYTIATAEVASTLFENFVFDEVLPTLSPKEQVVALHNKIMGSVQTIFRQIACFNFEVELHETIRREGHLPKDKIAALMNKHMQSYLGPIFKLEDNDGYFYVYWSHVRRFFYVFSYAFGELVSNALYEEYQKDAKFKAKIKQFLSAGGSASPEDIFKQIGIDVRDPKFFELGLKKIEDDIKKLERAIKSLE